MSKALEDKNKTDIFFIDRIDDFFDFPGSSKVYDLSTIPLPQLTLKEKEDLFPTIKKLVLSSSQYPKLKSSILKILLISSHLFLMLSGICASALNEDSFTEDKKKFIFISKIFIINSILIPFLTLSYYSIFKTSRNTQRLMYNISNYIINLQSNLSPYFTYQIMENDLSIKVKRKEGNVKEEMNRDILFSHVINVHIDTEFEPFLHRKIIPYDDFAILAEIAAFLNKEFKTKFEKHLNNIVIPAIFSCLSCAAIGNNYYIISLCIILSAVTLFESFCFFCRTMSETFNDRLEFKLKNINMISKGKGKYLYRYNRMLMLFTLTQKGINISQKALDAYIHKIINE